MGEKRRRIDREFEKDDERGTSGYSEMFEWEKNGATNR